MNAPRHTPYDGSSKLFEIGLKPLDPAEWIDADALLAAYLAEKDRLAAGPAPILVAEPGTGAAAAELLALLAAHLPARFPEIYRRDGDHMEIVPAGRRVALSGAAPLAIASRLVQEDLVLMRRDPAGWRLVAAALAFPSSWSIAEKFGRTLDEIHAPVPGFGAGTRPAELIARMFDHLRPAQPVIRWNWSLYGDGRLAHPETAPPAARRFGEGLRADNVFLRAERQTLRKLPESGDIVFTIRIYVDPLAALERHSDARPVAGALVAQLRALTEAQAAYKGLTLERDRLIARLSEIAER